MLAAGELRAHRGVAEDAAGDQAATCTKVTSRLSSMRTRTALRSLSVEALSRSALRKSPAYFTFDDARHGRLLAVHVEDVHEDRDHDAGFAGERILGVLHLADAPVHGLTTARGSAGAHGGIAEELQSYTLSTGDEGQEV